MDRQLLGKEVVCQEDKEITDDKKTMHKIPARLRKELSSDPEYAECAMRGLYSRCDGRITWEHALIFKGKQIQERFAIIPLCEKPHGVGPYLDAGTIQKERNIWIALNRASDDELAAISKAVDYSFERDRLNEKYGIYKKPRRITIRYD